MQAACSWARGRWIGLQQGSDCPPCACACSRVGAGGSAISAAGDVQIERPAAQDAMRSIGTVVRTGWPACRGRVGSRPVGPESQAMLDSGGNSFPNGQSVDFIVGSDSFQQYDLFVSLRISNELEYNAIFEIDRTGPRACQVSFQFMSVKCRMKCIISKSS